MDFQTHERVEGLTCSECYSTIFILTDGGRAVCVTCNTVHIAYQHTELEFEDTGHAQRVGTGKGRKRREVSSVKGNRLSQLDEVLSDTFGDFREPWETMVVIDELLKQQTEWLVLSGAPDALRGAVAEIWVQIASSLREPPQLSEVRAAKEGILPFFVTTPCIPLTDHDPRHPVSQKIFMDRNEAFSASQGGLRPSGKSNGGDGDIDGGSSSSEFGEPTQVQDIPSSNTQNMDSSSQMGDAPMGTQETMSLLPFSMNTQTQTQTQPQNDPQSEEEEEKEEEGIGSRKVKVNPRVFGGLEGQHSLFYQVAERLRVNSDHISKKIEPFRKEAEVLYKNGMESGNADTFLKDFNFAFRDKETGGVDLELEGGANAFFSASGMETSNNKAMDMLGFTTDVALTTALSCAGQSTDMAGIATSLSAGATSGWTGASASDTIGGRLMDRKRHKTKRKRRIQQLERKNLGVDRGPALINRAKSRAGYKPMVDTGTKSCSSSSESDPGRKVDPAVPSRGMLVRAEDSIFKRRNPGYLSEATTTDGAMSAAPNFGFNTSGAESSIDANAGTLAAYTTAAATAANVVPIQSSGATTILGPTEDLEVVTALTGGSARPMKKFNEDDAFFSRLETPKGILKRGGLEMGDGNTQKRVWSGYSSNTAAGAPLNPGAGDHLGVEDESVHFVLPAMAMHPIIVSGSGGGTVPKAEVTRAKAWKWLHNDKTFLPVLPGIHKRFRPIRFSHTHNLAILTLACNRVGHQVLPDHMRAWAGTSLSGFPCFYQMQKLAPSHWFEGGEEGRKVCDVLPKYRKAFHTFNTPTASGEIRPSALVKALGHICELLGVGGPRLSTRRFAFPELQRVRVTGKARKEILTMCDTIDAVDPIFLQEETHPVTVLMTRTMMATEMALGGGAFRDPRVVSPANKCSEAVKTIFSRWETLLSTATLSETAQGLFGFKRAGDGFSMGPDWEMRKKRAETVGLGGVAGVSGCGIWQERAMSIGAMDDDDFASAVRHLGGTERAVITSQYRGTVMGSKQTHTFNECWKNLQKGRGQGLMAATLVPSALAPTAAPRINIRENNSHSEDDGESSGEEERMRHINGAWDEVNVRRLRALPVRKTSFPVIDGSKLPKIWGQHYPIHGIPAPNSNHLLPEWHRRAFITAAALTSTSLSHCLTAYANVVSRLAKKVPLLEAVEVDNSIDMGFTVKMSAGILEGASSIAPTCFHFPKDPRRLPDGPDSTPSRVVYNVAGAPVAESRGATNRKATLIRRVLGHCSGFYHAENMMVATNSFEMAKMTHGNEKRRNLTEGGRISRSLQIQGASNTIIAAQKAAEWGYGVTGRGMRMKIVRVARKKVQKPIPLPVGPLKKAQHGGKGPEEEEEEASGGEPKPKRIPT